MASALLVAACVTATLVAAYIMFSWKQQAPAAPEPVAEVTVCERDRLHSVPSLLPVPEDEDWRPRGIGSCPPSKAYSTDLPLANLPMCVARISPDMKMA